MVKEVPYIILRNPVLSSNVPCLKFIQHTWFYIALNKTFLDITALSLKGFRCDSISNSEKSAAVRTDLSAQGNKDASEVHPEDWIRL